MLMNVRLLRDVKDEGIVTAARAIGFCHFMLAVLFHGRKMRGHFAKIRDPFQVDKYPEVVRALAEDAATAISDYLTLIDTKSEYVVRIIRRDKSGT